MKAPKNLRPVRLTHLFIAMAMIPLAATLLVYWMGLRVTAANQTLMGDQEVFTGLADLLSTLKDAETGERGFLLTGDEEYLQPYDAAIRHVDAHLKQLKDWAVTGDVAPDLAEAVDRLTREKLAELKQTIATRRQNGVEAATAMVRSHLSKSLMDDLRGKIGAMQAQEQTELLAARQQRDTAIWRRTLVTAASSLLMLLFLLWAFQRIRQGMADIQRQKELLGVTLTSIGDGVIVTDAQGRVTQLNAEAQRLTGWTLAEAQGQPLVSVFNIINEETRQPVESPVDKVLRLGKVVGLANHTLLIAKDGRETPIDDSGAPVCLAPGAGAVLGVVLVFRDFSERRRAEEALRESEQHFRALAEAITNLAWWANADGYITWYNRRWYEYTGTTPQQMEGWGWQSVHDPQALPAVMERWKASIATGEPFDMTFPLRGADGQFRRFLTRIQPVRDAQGRVARWFGTNTDVEELKRAEEALRASERLYRAIGESIDYGIWVCDAQGRNTYASASFLRLMGITQEQCAGLGWGDVLHPDDLEATIAAWKQCVQSGGPLWYREHRYRGADGQYHPILACGVPVRDDRGEVTAWAGINLDISELKQAEEALRQSLERMQRVLDVQTVGVMFWDLNTGCLVDANDTFLKMMGYSRSDVEAHDLTWQKFTPPEFYEVSRAEVAKFMATGRVGPYEKEYFRKDGTRQWLLFAGSSLGNNQCVEFCVDISDRKKAEDELKAATLSAEQAKAAAESASKAKDHFLAVLSHELRNPLNPVLATVSMLQQDSRFDADTREQLEVIRRNAELEARLIDDLLDVTRIERGKVELDRQPLELGTIIKRAVEVCLPDIQARNLEFGVDAPDGPYWVDADAARMQQVFWNLLKNSVKFTPEGGCVGIRCRRDNGVVVVEVNDSGVGIEAEALGRLFNAFVQAERSTTRQFGGLGLGLAISKNIVEMHGGSIHAHSHGKGKGATFTVKLPLLPAQPASDLANVPSAAAAPAPSAPPPKLRILLVEDHGDTARIMHRLLSSGGHDVQHAADVATGLRLATEQPFDLLLSDLGLPDGSGLDLMRALRGRGLTLPGIALSGFGQETDLQQSRAAGFAAHLLKPVNLPRLEEAIAKITGDGAPEGNHDFVS